jgi:hypothetical protein
MRTITHLNLPSLSPTVPKNISMSLGGGRDGGVATAVTPKLLQWVISLAEFY